MSVVLSLAILVGGSPDTCTLAVNRLGELAHRPEVNFTRLRAAVDLVELACPPPPEPLVAEESPPAPSQPKPKIDSTYRGMGDNVERWRGLVSAYFGGETNRALCVMARESGGNPNALNSSSGAAGLFQIMPFWWDAYGGDRFDPETNTALAKKIRDQQGWSAWSAYNRGGC